MVRLLLIALCASIFIGFSTADQCASFHDNYFYASSRPVSEAWSYTCLAYQNDTCCTTSYQISVALDYDPIFTAIRQNLDAGSINLFCRDKLYSLSCMPCSSSQAKWINLHNYGVTIDVCASYCSQLYSSCASATFLPQHAPVSSVFANADEFCHALLAGSNFTLNVRNQEDDCCWSDVRLCNDDDMFPIYGECIQGTRTLYYGWKTTAQCKGGSLPPPVTGLPCAVACPEGTYLRPGTTDCSPCPAGSFSLGGGEQVSYWSGSWSDYGGMFRTQCYERNYGNLIPINDPTCGWTLSGPYTTSGPLEDDQVSILQMDVVLVRDGSLRFTFMVDAEPNYDGLVVYVDNKEVVPLTSTQNYLREITIPLTKGYHAVYFAYVKDFSISEGQDMAIIQMIEVNGVDFADSHCTLCSPGQFQDQTRQRACYNCLDNTYSDSFGAEFCSPCPADMYSFSRATLCIERKPCTTDDYTEMYSSCQVDGKRVKYYAWVTPMICDSSSLQLPEMTVVDCGACNPGTYRPEGSTSCLDCPEGTVSWTNADACTPCQPGQYAPKVVLLYSFSEWPAGMSTFCNYQCGTNGWRLLNDRIDSGFGHGMFAQSVLRYQQNFEITGRVSFTMKIDCQTRCELRFTDGRSVNRRYLGGPYYYYPPNGFTYTYVVAAGNATLEWTFTKYDFDMVSRSDRATIFSIRLQGVSEGGGSNCTSCPAGYYSPTGQTCVQTPAGFFSPAGAIQPTQCDQYSFQPKAGQASCIPCGSATFSTDDRLACVVTCTFSPPSNPSITYDLSALKTTDDMYGPITDSVTSYFYFVNMCSEQHSNRSCTNSLGEPMTTFACQQLPRGDNMDLGNIIGFEELPNNLDSGLTVIFTHGDECVPRFGVPFNRQTIINMRCNPEAGYGMPRAAGPVIEVSMCLYLLDWESAYACPICTEDDYVSVTTECVEGQRARLFGWKYPKRCHDGVLLPDLQTLYCVNPGIICGPGQFIDFDTLSCQLANPGFYAVGGGELYDDWTYLPESFSTNGWTLQGDSIRSGFGDTSLFTTQVFKVPGSVAFQVVVNTLTAQSELQFFIDEVLISTYLTTEFRYQFFSFNFTSGKHLFKWAYVNGSHDSLAVIDRIIFRGLDYADEREKPCIPGKYSSIAGASSCLDCPHNTYAYGYASTSCSACDANQYSQPGSDECLERLPCQSSDFAQTAASCDASIDQTTISYLALQPQICFGQPPSSYTAECPSCRPGSYRTSSGTCAMCPLGTYFSATSKTCVQVPRGSMANVQVGYFFDTESQLPPAFQTYSSSSIGSRGWRVLGDAIDSGYYYTQEAESVLQLDTQFINDGTVSFEYLIDGDPASISLQVFVGYKVVPIAHPSHRRSDWLPVSFAVAAGHHTISWSFHQDSDFPGRVIVRKIYVTNSIDGGAVDISKCPAGYVASNDGQTSCEICPPGTYSDEGAFACVKCPSNSFAEFAGSTECVKCGPLTQSNDDRTSCFTSCTYTTENRTVDLTPLAHLTSFPLQYRQSEMLLSICNKFTDVRCLDSRGFISTYACEVKNNVGTDAGHLLGVHWTEYKGEEIVRMMYSRGNDSVCPGIKVTELNVICDLNGTDTSLPVEQPEVNNCYITLEWRTPYGCYLCTDNDYVREETECTNGEQSITYIKHTNCNGPKVLSQVQVNCSTRYKLPLVVVIVAALFFLLLCGALIVIYIRNRRLETRYTMLVNESSKTYEMSAVPPPST